MGPGSRLGSRSKMTRVQGQWLPSPMPVFYPPGHGVHLMGPWDVFLRKPGFPMVST